MRGRKPNPAAVRALHGSRTRAHHRDALPPDDDQAGEPPELAAPAIKPPVGLTKAERTYWHRFAPLLAGARVLTPADVETLADYCRACAAVEIRARRLRVAMNKRILDNQLVRLLDTSMRGWVERKTKLAGELALTAISRTRVGWSGHPQRVSRIEKPQSKLAELQARAAALRRPVG